MEGDREISKYSIFNAGYFQNAQTGKTVVVFPTARLGNTKIMAYIIKMRYLHENIERASTLFEELRDQQIFMFLCGPLRR